MLAIHAKQNNHAQPIINFTTPDGWPLPTRSCDYPHNYHRCATSGMCYHPNHAALITQLFPPW